MVKKIIYLHGLIPYGKLSKPIYLNKMIRSKVMKKHLKHKGLMVLSLLAIIMTFSACGAKQTLTPPSKTIPEVKPTNPGQKPSPTTSPTPSPIPDQEKSIIVVSELTEIESELISSIQQMRQPQPMDISKIDLGDSYENEIKNIYYNILSQSPELKYAYDISTELEDDILQCKLSFMPYKNGTFPKNFDGIEITSLRELIKVAEENIGTEPASIRILDPSLDVDDMSRALQQVGEGFVVCLLNTDATKIVYSPSDKMSMDQCLNYIKEVNELADAVISQMITEDMTQKEKALTLYTYLTKNVIYDYRYYTDRENMPFVSTTAYGALKNNLAICGGYSHALNILFKKVGIECFNVSGVYNGEDHIWNIAKLDNQWLYFDATSDSGLTEESQFKSFGSLPEKMKEDHQWDEAILNPIIN